MSCQPIGVVAAAIDIPEEIVQRFLASFGEGDIVHIERSMGSETTFSKSMALNRGIRALAPECRAIVCTDIDMLVPPGLLSRTAAVVTPGTCVWALCRNIEPSEATPRAWNQWLSRPLRKTGAGSWVGMVTEDWARSGGWDERLHGWGGEDYIFRGDRKAVGIVDAKITDLALMHVNHPRRTLRRAKQNMRIGRTRPPRNWLQEIVRCDPV